MSKPRREYDVYLESELSLGIACGELVVPPNIEVFKVREVLEGETEAADDNYRPRELLLNARIDQLREDNERLQAKVERLTKRGFQDLNDENEQLRGLLES